MISLLSLLALALPALTAETTVIDVLVFPPWQARNLTASVKAVEKSVTTWVYGCKAPATFCGLPEGATVMLGPTTYSQDVSYADPSTSIWHHNTINMDCDIDQSEDSMVCATYSEETRADFVDLEEDPSLVVTNLTAYITPIAFVGGIEMLGGSSADATQEVGTTGTESGGSRSTGDADADSGSAEEDDDNSGHRATLDLVAAGLAGLIGAAGVI